MTDTGEERDEVVAASWLAAYENPGRIELLTQLHDFIGKAMEYPRLRELAMRLEERGLSFPELGDFYVDGPSGTDAVHEVHRLLNALDAREMTRLYPELPVEAHRAWGPEFERQGLPYAVRPGPPAHRLHKAVATNGERVATLGLSGHRRSFSVSLSEGGGVATHGRAPDLATTARAAGQWLGGASRVDVARNWPFLGSVALAEAVERGDEREVRWLRLYETRFGDRREARVADFIELAFHEPRLRATWPGFSHLILHFRAGDEVFAGAEPLRARGRYRVVVGDRRIVADTDAAGALAVVLDLLTASSDE